MFLLLLGLDHPADAREKHRERDRRAWATRGSEKRPGAGRPLRESYARPGAGVMTSHQMAWMV
jgi:hypothetical protein